MRILMALITVLLLAVVIELGRIEIMLMDHRPEQHRHLYYDVKVQPGAQIVIKDVNEDGSGPSE